MRLTLVSPISIQEPEMRSIARLVPSLGALILALTLVAPPADAGNWFTRGHHDNRIEGSGHYETRSFDLHDFDTIRIDGVFVIEVTAGEDYSVELEAEDNLLDLIIVEVRRGELVLDIDDDYDIETDEQILLTISMPALVEINGNGVYELKATGLDNEKTEIRAQGVGNIELEGRTRDLEVRCEGVGNVDLRNLVAQNADVRVEGVGDAYVNVEQDLRARVSGLGEIKYAGHPESVDDEVNGFGSIHAAR
jgi:hypothetical protein